MLGIIKQFLTLPSKVSYLDRKINHLHSVSNEQKIISAKIVLELNKGKQIKTLEEVEFKVFSQFGDDGIIQYLINNIEISNKTFIEFGVEDYQESNTRFLLINNNWSGLVMDSSEENIKVIKADEIYWKYDIIAKKELVTAENINNIIQSSGIKGEIGLLHIDIDGNDYWVWKALENVNPVIVIIEYNSVFGIKDAITIPYLPDFNRTKAHFSNLYYGASLLALNDLAEEKGYKFIGCNSAGNNSYFIRKDKLNNLINPVLVQDGYVKSKYAESRDVRGHLNFIRGDNRNQEIKGLKVFNTRIKEIQLL